MDFSIIGRPCLRPEAKIARKHAKLLQGLVWHVHFDLFTWGRSKDVESPASGQGSRRRWQRLNPLLMTFHSQDLKPRHLWPEPCFQTRINFPFPEQCIERHGAHCASAPARPAFAKYVNCKCKFVSRVSRAIWICETLCFVKPPSNQPRQEKREIRPMAVNVVHENFLHTPNSIIGGRLQKYLTYRSYEKTPQKKTF